MSSSDRQENEDFNLEVDSAVESFFSHYEGNAPKMNVSSHELESEIISKEKTDHETDDSSLEPIFAMLSETEKDSETGNSPTEPEQNTAPRKEKPAPEKHISGSGRRAQKKFNPGATIAFNSLTEAILTVDWEVNETTVKEARENLEEIKTNFPALKESRAQKVVDGMLTILDSIAASPQRVPTSATAQLEKAIPILRGIASGAKMEDGYDELLGDVISGLEDCRAEIESAEDGTADSPGLMTHDGTAFDKGDGAALETEELEPIAVPAEISRALCHHSEVVAQLTPRARRLSDLYAAAQGSENVQALLQKICGLLELQTRALQDAFSLNCDIAIFPIGKIKNLSDFLDVQLKAMGVCARHARVLEKTYKTQPHRKKFRQSVYFLRIAMERQIDELSSTARGDAPARETGATVPPPL